MGVIPNPKMAFIFPISCILALIFPILIKYFPKCVGKGSFPNKITADCCWLCILSYLSFDINTFVKQLTHLSLASFLWANNVEPDQTLQNVASDQVLYYFLTQCSFKI